jgi:hypothetical protein
VGGGYDSVLCIFIFIYNTVSGISEYPLIQKTKRQERSRNDFSTFFSVGFEIANCLYFILCSPIFYFHVPPPFSRFITLCYTHFARNTYGNMKWLAAKLRRRASHTTANEALVGAGGLLWVPTETRQEFSISLSSFDIRKACTPLRKFIALSAREAQVKEKRSKKKKNQVLSFPPQNKMTELEYVIGCSTLHYIL